MSPYCWHNDDFGRKGAFVSSGQEGDSWSKNPARSKQPAFNGISIDGPRRIGEFFAAVKLQIRSWAYSLDERPDDARLAAVDCAVGL